MQMDQLYQEIILDHYRAPHHHGLREPFQAQVQHVNPVCGDEVTLRVRLADPRDAGSAVVDVSYDGAGCSISQASTSVMTDLVIGRPLPQALEVLDEFTDMVTSRGTKSGDEDALGDAVAFAGVARYPARVKCALLGWMAFKDAATQAVTGSAGAGAASAASADNTPNTFADTNGSDSNSTGGRQ
ncbi:Fe-S cluster assembly sulfur transfer protein SufU [Nakamurella aerolata]|uniref:SUF system NifU family Fe-S cluster assembly protein n=1 Tax=Nakamurella aerolata TaxID=1656892 RepID=A0A849A138_9ACTN|nr:SUF system NifU family Fe-S cluster assembly protein [Nakamurella aerolata]NNG34295.1 SUF system NifU family Fe-S cluster assembly protein [Nakamurella aerolata]